MVSIAVKYTYNKNGQVTAVTRPDGLVTSYDYDALGRVSKVSMPTDTINYVYDAKSNNLTAVGNKSSAISYSYDGGVLTKAQWSGSVNGSVGVRFNAKMQVDTQSVNDSHKIGFIYDNDGLLTKAGDLTIKRDGANGRLTGTVLGNLKDTLIYSATGDLSVYQATVNGSNLFKTEITETDKLGRIVEKRETIDGVTNTYRYGYDKVGQLVEVRKNGSVVESYSYDANGNRLGTTVDGQDRLISANGVTYSYTANGELKTKTDATGTTTYEYDVQGNLLSVTPAVGSKIEYLIDANNRRIGKKVGGVLVQSFLYQSQLNPIAELDGSGNIVSRFVYGNRINVPEYMIKNGVTYKIVSDERGSVREVVNSSTGEVVQKISYNSFGVVTENSNPDFQPFAFCGGLYETNTKLTRFGARDYDADAGRWSSKEPLGFDAEENHYRYCHNDPINSSDVNGRADNDIQKMMDAYNNEPSFQYEFWSGVRDWFADQYAQTENPLLFGGGLGSQMMLEIVPKTNEEAMYAACGTKGGKPGISNDGKIGDLLKGTGQIPALQRNPNLKGVDTQSILNRTIAEAKELLNSKQFKTLMKHFEGRDLRHGK